MQPQLTKPKFTEPNAPILKRKIAIGRFSNSTKYGKALLLENERDPLPDQASDILARQLVESRKFLVFERPDFQLIQAEQSLQNKKDKTLVGVDSLIIGSVTEFGRKTEGKSGFLSSTKKQTAYASVAIRLIDVTTGLAFFSTKGTGNASIESRVIPGFCSKARYDSTLNDRALSVAIANAIQSVIQKRALSVAIANAIQSVIQKLEERPWQSDIIKIDQQTVMISGGKAQGLKIGDQLQVLHKGKTVKSQQTGLPITLPAKHLATIKVQSFFGTDEYSQGSIAHLVQGNLIGKDLTQLIVRESK